MCCIISIVKIVHQVRFRAERSEWVFGVSEAGEVFGLSEANEVWG